MLDNAPDVIVAMRCSRENPGLSRTTRGRANHLQVGHVAPLGRTDVTTTIWPRHA